MLFYTWTWLLTVSDGIISIDSVVSFPTIIIVQHGHLVTYVLNQTSSHIQLKLKKINFAPLTKSFLGLVFVISGGNLPVAISKTRLITN